MTEVSGQTVDDAVKKPAKGWFSDSRAFQRLRHQPIAIVCAIGVLALICVAVLAPHIVPHDPGNADVLNRFKAPSASHWLGTDDIGRDIFSRLVYGTRTATRTSFEAVGLAILIGGPIGLLVGYFGGWWDRIAMRATDIAQSVPSLIFAFAVIAILGRGTNQTAIAVAIVFAIILLRISRGLVLRERELLYVDAARVSGLSTIRILFREILPNVLGPLIVESALMLGSAILLVTMLSFLGLGLDSDTPDWGSMLDDARKHQFVHPFMTLPPGLAIMFAVLLFNFTGDSLRDAFMGQSRLRGAPDRRRTKADTKSAAPAVRPAGNSDVVAIEGLRVTFPGEAGRSLEILSDVKFSMRRGETVGLVGESGSGKSTTGMAMVGLLPSTATRTGQIWLDDRNLLTISRAEAEKLSGAEIAVIFQDPVGAFSPVHTVGQQLIEPLQNHEGLSKQEATRRAVELLNLVGIPDAAKRINDYPHQFSGGMAQRAMIAMAFSCGPKVLIADEPTSALDVTVQAQVLGLLDKLSAQFDMAVLLITHDLGVVAESCDRVLVMYAGQIVEEGQVADVLTHPRHPYTHALLKATPRNEAPVGRLPTVPGTVPPPWNWPQGCRFSPRCPYVIDRCTVSEIPFIDGLRCIRAGELELGLTP